MSNTIEKIKELLTVKIITLILGFIFIVLIWVRDEILSKKLIELIDKTESSTILKVIYFLVIFLLISISISILHIIKNKKKKKFGIYWDKEGETYCPLCKKPTTRYQWDVSEPYFHCSKCNTDIYMQHNGKFLHIELAKELLDIKKITPDEIKKAIERTEKSLLNEQEVLRKNKSDLLKEDSLTKEEEDILLLVAQFGSDEMGCIAETIVPKGMHIEKMKYILQKTL